MKMRQAAAGLVCGLGFCLGSIESAASPAETTPYPTMAPLTHYLEASAADEIAVARSAAPPSISDKADVLTLTITGYSAAVKGENGFVCLVQRSWGAAFDDPEFWNPKIRGPICLNPAAARSVLPAYLERTSWALAGASKSEMISRTRASLAANTFVAPEAGAIGFMMSKQARLSDSDPHWHPHLMFFLSHGDAASWGANLAGSPIYAQQSDPEPVTTFFVPVTKWSDSTPEATTPH
jgi:hypothetical protein